MLKATEMLTVKQTNNSQKKTKKSPPKNPTKHLKSAKLVHLHAHSSVLTIGCTEGK